MTLAVALSITVTYAGAVVLTISFMLFQLSKFKLQNKNNLFYDASITKDENAIGISDCGQSMRHNNGSTAFLRLNVAYFFRRAVL